MDMDIKIPLHKQPRNLLKTLAKGIGNSGEELTLFTMPQTEGGIKEEISKNTGALAFYLIQLYQQNNSKPLEIPKGKLSPISRVMNCNNYRLKIYLLYLGGYNYPIIDKNDTGELIVKTDKLFDIEFVYSQKVADKYSVNNGQIKGVERIGTEILTFIKNEELDRVIITPNSRFIKALEGKGLGNILTANDKFVGLILELSDIATKILTYSSSNKPSQKIGEESLVKHLGLIKQVKKQGMPRVRGTILKGLQELKDKGHIRSYSFEEATRMYSFNYTNKFVQYSEGKKGKKGKKQPPLD
jgi:hypothetical protein